MSFPTFLSEHGKLQFYILAVYSYCLYRSLQCFFIFCKQLGIAHVHKLFNVFLWSYEFIAPVHFLTMKLSGIIAITNSKGDSASWIFTTAYVFLPAVNSILQFFMTSVINFITLSNILYIFKYSIIQVYGTIL